MKKVIVILTILLGISFTNCQKTENVAVTHQALSEIPHLSSLKTGGERSKFNKKLEQELDKLLRKLEIKVKEKRNANDGILIAAAEQPEEPIPIDELFEELDEASKVEFINEMTHVSTDLLENTFNEDVSLATDNANIVLAALISDYLYTASDEGYCFDHTAPGVYTLYTPPGVSGEDPNNTILVQCILHTLVNFGAVIGTGTTITLGVTLATQKTLTFTAIKAVIKSVLASMAFTSEITGPQGAAIVGGAAVVTITIDTLACLLHNAIDNIS